jgi:hypothetical protein
MVAYACPASYGVKYKTGGLWSRLAWAKSEILPQKHPEEKRTRDLDQMAEHLHSKCKALSSNPVPQKKKRTLIFL